ncbi:hypothetical protein NIES2111_61640 (plasmid) [Nostoc sp. NIES-2111]|nr:hypothetical protein NIES2111_61640 [Nostoc sp. NIES-2111]
MDILLTGLLRVNRIDFKDETFRAKSGFSREKMAIFRNISYRASACPPDLS